MANKQQVSTHENQHRSAAEYGGKNIPSVQVQSLAPPPFQLKASGESPDLEAQTSQSSNYLMAIGAADLTNNGVSQQKQSSESFQIPIQKQETTQLKRVAPFQLKASQNSSQMSKDVRGKMENAFQANSSNINNKMGASSTLIQTKLEINTPSDTYEQEADHMADQVMKMPGPSVQRKCSTCGSKTEEEHIQRMPLAAQTSPVIQQKCAKCEEEKHTVQTKAEGQTPSTASPSLSSRIQSTKGQGQAMDSSTIQRKLVVDADDSIPLPEGTNGRPQSLTNSVQQLINQTCPDGNFQVNDGTGAVTLADPTFCEDWHAPLSPDVKRVDNASTPAGCDCLCDVVNHPNTTTIDFKAGGPSVSPGSRVGEGLGHDGVETNPTVNLDPSFEGQYRINRQWVDVPFFLLFSHELCGHALPKMEGTHAHRGPTPTNGTPPHEIHAVNVERNIAAENGLPLRPRDYSGAARPKP